jgi:prophage regulatory protein
MNATNPDRLVRITQLPDFGIPYSRVHLARMAKAGKFPAPIKLSHKCIAWRASVIEAWIAEREAESARALEVA